MPLLLCHTASACLAEELWRHLPQLGVEQEPGEDDRYEQACVFGRDRAAGVLGHMERARCGLAGGQGRVAHIYAVCGGQGRLTQTRMVIATLACGALVTGRLAASSQSIGLHQGVALLAAGCSPSAVHEMGMLRSDSHFGSQALLATTMKPCTCELQGRRAALRAATPMLLGLLRMRSTSY